MKDHMKVTVCTVSAGLLLALAVRLTPSQTVPANANRGKAETKATYIKILPDENLRAYKARMDRYFANEIRRRGLAALVNDEASEYNEVQRFITRWEPKLDAFDGDFKKYFQLEKNYYGDQRRRAAATAAKAGPPNPWVELGPITKSTTNVGSEGIGPTKFITFYGPAPSRMLCGANASGLFYSNNGGVTWSRTGTDTLIARSGVGTAVFHPTDYHIWFAASAGNSGDGDPMWIGPTGGIFITPDEGVTWSQIANETQLGGIWTKIFKLVINPTNANQLWAATSTGLYMTTNALAASPVWTSVPALSGKYIYDLEDRPLNFQWLYAAVADWGANGPFNWRYMFSSNNGSTWQNVPGQSTITANAGRLTIEVTKAKPDNLYCLTTDLLPSGKLHIYDFGSGTWTLVYGATNIISSHAFGVDPINPNEIFLSHHTEMRRYTYNQTGTTYINSLSTYSTAGTYHPDIEDVIPHPVNPNEVWMCNHGGVYVSFDNGQNWTDRSIGLGVAQVIRMATSASDPSYVAVGLYHDGTMLTTSPWYNLWAPGWKTLPGSFCDGLSPMINPTNPQHMWHSCQPGGWRRSSNTGVTFSSNPPSSPFWIVEAAFNRLNPQTQYRLSLTNNNAHTIKRTTDGGNTWTQIADFQSLYPSATHQYIVVNIYTPETNGDYLIVHLLEKPVGAPDWSNHHLYRTTIANALAANVISSWTELPVPSNVWFGSVVFDAVDPNVVYIANNSSNIFSTALTGTGMVFKVNYTNPAVNTYNVCNPGLCWDLTQNLPNSMVGGESLALELGSNSGLYLGTDFGGVWFSNNATRATGAGWSQLGTGLPNVSTNGLEINYIVNKVRIATFGRGVWEADLHVGCVEPPLALGLWLPLDESTGTTSNNLAPQSQSGTRVGSPVPTPAGKVAGALCFNGTNNFVDVPSYPYINFGTGDFSLDAWVKRTSNFSGTDVLIDKRTDAGGMPRGYSLFLYSNQIGLQLADGSYANYLSPAVFPSDGLWHHVAVTVVRNNSTGGRFYFDGKVVGSPFNPTARAGSLNTSAPFRLGSRSALFSSGLHSAVLHGCLDEVEAFNRALNADEVLSIYRAGNHGKCK